MAKTQKLSALLLIVMGCVGLAGYLSAGDGASTRSGEWPQFRGPNRDGVSTETGLLHSWGPSGPALAWKASGLGGGFSSVSIAGGKIFTMGDLGESQYIIALDLAGGKQLWKSKVGPAWDDDKPGPRGTPTVDGDLVYAIGTDGDLVCVEAATGRERWRKSLPRDFGGRMMTMWKYSESPLVDGAKLLVTPGGHDAAIIALDKKSGQEIWRSRVPSLGPRGRDGAGYSSIVISEGAGVRQYVQLMGRGLVGVRTSDGKFLWGYNRIANDVANVSTPIVKGDYVFASTGYQTGAALLKLIHNGDAVDAQEVYFLGPRTLQNHHGGLVLVGDYLYGGQGHNNGLPICVEFLTGKVMWGGDTRNAGSGSAAVVYADGNLIFRYQNGMVVLIEASPKGYKENGQFEIPGVSKPSWPHPVVAGGMLYLREQDALFCYRLRN